MGYEAIKINANDIQYVDATEKANVDSQVATAKQYPRDIEMRLMISKAMLIISSRILQILIITLMI